ncbi:MAG: aldehyde dehydrogenase family protein [Candidatus Omnitrophota bacterium]|jgi:betaine-aldehyde dehydrogenase|nr:MAG: aldehyde dehydrogenase family protein [Candidatus Omnitrophota bacterium]
MNTKLLINGQLIETKQKERILNPSTGRVIEEVSLASKAELENALESARIAFDRGQWPRLGYDERREFILKIKQGILDNAAELAKIETLNTGKPIKETTFMDIPSSAKSFEYMADNFEKFLSEEKISIQQEAECRLMRSARGVAVLIIPWNYPLLIASWKLASALCAGNTVILKPSSLTPLSVLELARIIHDIGFPKGAVNIINAPGAEAGQLLCASKSVDMVSFTGSNEVGRQIINYTSTNVKKLIMELGGKSASIIMDDVDLDVAVNSNLCSIFLNQGQMCTAMSRILVHEKIYDKFVETFVRKTRSIKLGQGEDFQTQMGPLISISQIKKIITYIDKAKKEGAHVCCGGRAPEDPSLKNGFYFEPTVITNVNAHMEVFKEEVFGPVVCIMKFSSIAEAVEIANNSDFALAASIWTNNKEVSDEIANKINAGIIWINTYGMFYNQAPYGGFKQSGFGKELGREGFLEYTGLKNVIVDRNPQGKPLVNYWYGF